MQRPPFRLTPQVAVVAAVAAVALVLPVGMIAWTLVCRESPPRPEPLSPAGLRSRLESLAGDTLGNPTIQTLEVLVRVADPVEAGGNLEELVGEMGGTCVASDAGDGSLRLLVRLPAGDMCGFRRRAELLCGAGLAGIPASGELVVLTLTPAEKD